MKSGPKIHPDSDIWFIRYIIGNNASVLKELLFCEDAHTRASFSQLITVALTTLYSTSTEMAADRCLLTQIHPDPLRETDMAEISQSILTLLSKQLLESIDETCIKENPDSIFAG